MGTSLTESIFHGNVWQWCPLGALWALTVDTVHILDSNVILTQYASLRSHCRVLSEPLDALWLECYDYTWELCLCMLNARSGPVTQGRTLGCMVSTYLCMQGILVPLMTTRGTWHFWFSLYILLLEDRISLAELAPNDRASLPSFGLTTTARGAWSVKSLKCRLRK